MLGYSVFNMEITSDDGAGPQEVTTCGNNGRPCRFIVCSSANKLILCVEPHWVGGADMLDVYRHAMSNQSIHFCQELAGI